MNNPDAHRPVGTITDRDGRPLEVLTDYGDVLLGAGGDYRRLSLAHVVQLEYLLSAARWEADQLEAVRLEREAE